LTAYLLLFKIKSIYIFNARQIATSGVKLNIFLARAKTNIQLKIQQNKPF